MQFTKLKRISEKNMRGKKDLLLEGKTAIFVRVEESDEAVGLRFGSAEVALISEIVEYFKGGDISVAVSVKSLEGRVRGEVADGAETLASEFEAHLTATDGDEKILKSAFRFKSKAHGLKTINA